MTTQNYVAGFLFSEDKKRVALIEKTHPDWQKGKLNGIGGKIDETDESPSNAMAREFEEETGMLIKKWRLFCVLKWRGESVFFFTATGDLSQLRSMEEEHVQTVDVSVVLSQNIIPNLKWLIPLALDKDEVTAVVEDQS